MTIKQALKILMCMILLVVVTACSSRPNDDAGQAPTPTQKSDQQTLDDAINQNSDTKVYSDLLAQSGIDDLISLDRAQYTIFMPSDEAISNAQIDIDSLMQSGNELALRVFVNSYIVDGAYDSTLLRDGQTLTSLSGTRLQISKDGDTIKISDVELIKLDTKHTGGYIHVVSGTFD